MNSQETDKEDYAETFKKISEHLKNVSIDIDRLNPQLVSKLVKYLSSSNKIDDSEIKRIFFENEVFLQKQYDEYASAAYLVGATLNLPNPNNFLSVVPDETLLYMIKCELKAALTRDVSYTVSGKSHMTLPKIKRCLKSTGLENICNYENLLRTAKEELGLVKIKPKINKKKEQRKKQLKEKPKLEQIVEAPRKAESELESECNFGFNEKPKKFVPPEPGKKRRQKLRSSFDVAQIETRVKQKITAGISETDIINYVQKQTNSDYETARAYLNDVVYDTVKTALRTNKTASKNTINYISKSKQEKLAEEYITTNSISETIGIRRISTTKDILMKHLSLDESKIDWLIESKLEQFISKSEKENYQKIEAKFVESNSTIDESKPIFPTQHVKQRALQRIGMGADKHFVLKDMFHSGRTIHPYYDEKPHRIFEFSGEWFEMPYVDTGEEYVLLTVFPRKNY